MSDDSFAQGYELRMLTDLMDSGENAGFVAEFEFVRGCPIGVGGGCTSAGGTCVRWGEDTYQTTGGVEFSESAPEFCTCPGDVACDCDCSIPAPPPPSPPPAPPPSPLGLSASGMDAKTLKTLLISVICGTVGVVLLWLARKNYARMKKKFSIPIRQLIILWARKKLTRMQTSVREGTERLYMRAKSRGICGFRMLDVYTLWFLNTLQLLIRVFFVVNTGTCT